MISTAQFRSEAMLVYREHVMSTLGYRLPQVASAAELTEIAHRVAADKLEAMYGWRTEPPFPDLPARPTDQKQIAAGEVLYNRYCSRCHVMGRGNLPDLRRIEPGTHALFSTIVLGGAFAAKGMGRFDDVLSPADVDAIHAYVIDGGYQLKQ